MSVQSTASLLLSTLTTYSPDDDQDTALMDELRTGGGCGGIKEREWHWWVKTVCVWGGGTSDHDITLRGWGVAKQEYFSIILWELRGLWEDKLGQFRLVWLVSVCFECFYNELTRTRSLSQSAQRDKVKFRRWTSGCFCSGRKTSGKMFPLDI